MTDGLCEETQPCLILAVLFALHGADATRTDCRDMDLLLRKEGQMTALITNAKLINNNLCFELEDGSFGYVSLEAAIEAYKENSALHAESESRRVALEQKAEELRREWTRAERAEVENLRLNAIIQGMSKEMSEMQERISRSYGVHK